jgi:hypothetical protein
MPTPQCVRIRTPLYHPDFPYILFWSQKAGCTTVVKWFFAQLGLLEEALAHSRWVHDYEQRVFKNRPDYRKDVAAALASGRHKAVKIVRDPLARAPSAFLILGERGAVITHRRHWVQDHWDRVDTWLQRQGKDPAEGISFVDHLAYVKEAEAEAAHSIDQHISPQFVEGEEAFLDEVVPIERFADWVLQVSGSPGVQEVDLEAIATSHHHHISTPERTAALGARPEETPIRRGAFADGRFPSGKAFVNARTIPLIRNVYRADFRAYGTHYREAHAAAGAG